MACKRNTQKMTRKSGPLPLSKAVGPMPAAKESAIRIKAVVPSSTRLCVSVPGKNEASEISRRKANLKPAGSLYSRLEPFSYLPFGGKYDHGVIVLFFLFLITTYNPPRFCKLFLGLSLPIRTLIFPIPLQRRQNP